MNKKNILWKLLIMLFVLPLFIIPPITFATDLIDHSKNMEIIKNGVETIALYKFGC